jgi:ribose transport system ATP-binding protein
VNILEAKNIKKNFGGVAALSGASLTCREGRITGLLGANGSGKSTLSKIIAGVYAPDDGEITYLGKKIHYKNPHEAKQQGIGMVYQNLSLVPELTVWQNIVLGDERNAGYFLDDKNARERTTDIVHKLLPTLDIEKKVFELTPSEMQVVEIAKAVSRKPKLLILDEPTAALEKVQVTSLFNMMKELASSGVAIIFTSHRLWEVVEICHDLTIFRNGRNVGSMDFDKDEKDVKKIIFYITGSQSETSIAKTCAETCGETRLSIKNLSLGTILRNISFDLKKGEILGVGGLAGQGQQELMLALAGNFPKIGCDARIDGKPIKLTKPSKAIRNGIVLVPGDRETEGLFSKHSVFSNLIFSKIGVDKKIFIIPHRKLKKECEQIVDILALKAASLDAPVSTLSGGNQQKVVIGKWLGLEIKVLLLSDPAKGIDIGAKADLYSYIVNQVRSTGMSVVLYASDTKELIEYCDRLLIMYEGSIVATLGTEEITEENIIRASMHVEKE